MALGLTLYPLISNYVNQKYASQIHTAYEEVLEQTDDSALRTAREYAIAYNKTIVPGPADETYSQDALVAASKDYYDLLNITGDGIMGYVEIPQINVQLPIYHGTTAETLDRGVGHLLGSSLPVGGDSSHAILTGHSGMASQKMFTDLVQMEVGDVFYLHVLDKTLAYQVNAVNTVLPHENSLLGISQDQDLCTLITCVPYAVNTHRLLVTGSRIPYEEAEAIVEQLVQEELPQSSWEEKYIEGLMLGLAITIGLILGAVLFVQIRKMYAAGHHRKRKRGGKYAHQ